MEQGFLLMPEYRDFLLSKCQLCKGRSAVKGCLWPLVVNFATTVLHILEMR